MCLPPEFPPDPDCTLFLAKGPNFRSFFGAESDILFSPTAFEEDHRRSGKCFIGLASPRDVPEAPNPVKLNYTTVANVLQGLWQFTFLERRECEMVFKIEDAARERRREGEELVGFGKLLSSVYVEGQDNIEIE